MMNEDEVERVLTQGDVALLHDTLVWLAQLMAETIPDAVTTLAIARAAGLSTRVYARDADWHNPDNLAQLQRRLIAEAAAGGQLPGLLRALRTQWPDRAPSIDVMLQRCGRVLGLRMQVNPADMEVRQFQQQQQQQQQQQETETARPHARTRGRESDAEPATAGEHFETLRLDTAVPERVLLRQAFTLAVAVRRPSSPVLMRDGLPVTASGGVDVFWPEGAAWVTLRIRISAPDCTIHGSKGDKFRLLPGHDSPDFLYHLTPKRTGPISIIVTVYQEDERLGTAGVDTIAGENESAQAPAAMNRSLSLETAQPAGAITMQVQSHALLSLPVARALRGLHAVFIEYFRKRDEALVMASQAGLDTAYIRMSDILADLWWNVLELAHGEQRVGDLVDVAQSRVNRRAATLEAAYAVYASVI